MSISFIIPCKNEEDNIRDTVNEIIKSTKNIPDYEIIIIDDCSSDKTNNIIKDLTKNNNKIIQITNDLNLGYGGSFIKGYKVATKNYIILMPGDNCFPASEIEKMIINYKNFDLIMSIPTEMNDKREKHRKFFSKAFTLTVNILFNYNFRYYNGIPVIKKDVLEKINIKSKSPFFMAEIVLKTLKIKSTYDQREIFFIERKFGKTGIFNIKTVAKTIIDLIKLRINY
tara:strand:+ start:9297 stop:9977 length:681 start_codon:yes stop_codon:yes gene_type:complete